MTNTFKTIKQKSIEELDRELYVAHKRGYIFRYTPISELSGIGDICKNVGVEILFSDQVSVSKIEQIKAYIELKYDFYVDNTTYMDPVKPVKIVVVRY